MAHSTAQRPSTLPERCAPAIEPTEQSHVQPVSGGASPMRLRLAHLGELRNRWAARSFGLLPAACKPDCAGAAGILMYHRVVARPAGLPAPTWNVTPERFRAQLGGLIARGYRAWPLSKLLAHHAAGEMIPAQTFVVTFDDGYDNVHRNALPILREFDIPATVFLATGFLDSDGPFPFDDWCAAGSLDGGTEAWLPITSDHCDELLATGLIELGTHSHLHTDFRGRGEELRCDLAMSLELLRRRFGISAAGFAMPYGWGCRRDHGPEIADAARESGVSCALTTDSVLVRPGDDRFNWGRFAGLGSDSDATLAAKLDGRYSLARDAWRWLRHKPGGVRSASEPAAVRA